MSVSSSLIPEPYGSMVFGIRVPTSNLRSRPLPPPIYNGRTYDIDLGVELLTDLMTTFMQATLDS